jgi:hypothetical protein
MSNFAPYQNLDFAFFKLFEALSSTWSKSDIQFVNDLVSHAEYGEALENLVAIGRQNGKSFTDGQTRMIADIAAKMGVSIDGAAGLSPTARRA